MKISKSKKELARIISENGGWIYGAKWAAQDKYYSGKNNGVALYRAKPPRPEKGELYWGGLSGNMLTVIEGAELLPNWHQTILSREEYFHLYPAPDADGWIKCVTEDLPVAFGTIIDVKYSDGDELHGAECGVATTDLKSIQGACASAESFGRGDDFIHIIAYRLHKPEQAKPECCESETRSIPDPESKPTIEQLAADYRNRKDYADRKQQEAYAAKADAEAKLAELVAAGREIGLFLSVEITHVYSGKFYNAELGESPEYSETNNNSICEDCGKRLGQHYELASYCLSRTERERVGLLTL